MRQASAKTFAATVRVRRRMAGAPFGRLDISDERVTVRSWFPAWIGPHSAPKGTITEVTVYGWPAIYIKFTDDHGALLDAAVNPVRSRRVIREFRARGYPVVDLRLRHRDYRRPNERQRCQCSITLGSRSGEPAPRHHTAPRC